MKVYIPDEDECQEVTEGLEPAPLRKAFDDAQVPKNLRGKTFDYYVGRRCDGYYYFLMSMAGSKYRLTGSDFVAFGISGIFLFSLLLTAWSDRDLTLLIPFPNSGNEDYLLAAGVFIIVFFFFFLGLWVHQLAKKDGISFIVFNRENGTVTFPKIAHREGITVPFEEVDFAVAATHTSQGGLIRNSSIRTRVCRPGHPPREELVFIHGITHEEHMDEINLICRFMDKTQPIPACLHKAIESTQSNELDMWDKHPYPKDRIFDPPLHERELAPELEADLKEIEKLLREDGFSEDYISNYVQELKDA